MPGDGRAGAGGPLRIAIVGGGPSATYALERLDAVFGHGGHSDHGGPDRPLILHLFERTGEFGPGQVHSARQPHSSYLNRISAQVSFAADPASAGAGWLRPASQRPTLHEWCRRRYAATGCPDFDLAPEDWPRRYVHGLALAEQFEAYCSSLAAAGADVHRHPVEVTDVIDEQAHLVVVAGPSRIAVDRILFATGHPANDPDRDPEQRPLAEFARRCPGLRYVANVYPLEETLDAGRVRPTDRVGVLGMGLTAIDVLLYLTEGRGGTFVRESSGRLGYLPSGAEPAGIIAFSRSGLFTTARPLNQKQRDPGRLEHRGRFLTDVHVEAVRRARGLPAPAEAVAAGNRGRQLDFEADLLPLIVLEMAHVHYRVLLGEAVAHRMAEAVGQRLATFLHAELLEPAGPAWQWLLEPVQQVAGQVLRDGPERSFSWQHLLDPLPDRPGTSAAARQQAVLRFMRADDRDAAQGNLANPAKAAADGVWRDLRPVIARAIDFGGLTASSHRRFLERYLPLHNHLANGAAREVMEKIMALVAAGVVDVGIGPRPRLRVDEPGRVFQVLAADGSRGRQLNVLVAARVHPFKADLAAGPLYRNLLRRGLIAEWVNSSSDGTTFAPGGVRLDRRLHPLRPDGTSDDRLTFLGPPSEGARFFQLGALRPDSDHHVMRDVLGWVAGLPLPGMEESR